MPACQQFTPGRIDHHNVQIALALLVAAATVWSDRKRCIAAAAGALTGLAFAIGFESVAYLAICGAMLALRYVADADAGLALRDYGLALAQLPPGLVIADVGYGPYPLALTPHSVMAAPYHRLSTGIAVSHSAFSAPPDDARAIVNAARLVGAGGKPTYLMVCCARPPDGLTEPARGRSLWARLQAGSTPHWLEPVGERRPSQCGG